MALANPRQIQTTSPAALVPPMPILDHQNLLLFANSSPIVAAHFLFSGHSNPPNSSLHRPILQIHPQNPLPQLKLECPENLDGNEESAIAPVQPSNLATIPPMASHSTQQLLDRSILELLLAKSNALSLLSQSLLLPNFSHFLPTSTAPSLQPQPPQQNTFAPIPLRMDAMPPGNGVAGNEQKIGCQLDSQMDSLSRNKLGRSYNPGRPLGMLDRQKILELYQKGLKISHIAKVIGVTHSCVSKIMTRYRRTGSIHPRSAQLSLLSRRQPQLNAPNGPLILANSPTIPTIQFAGWQQCLPASNAAGKEMGGGDTLKCSFPSAFQRICGGGGVNSDEEREGSNNGSVEDGEGVGKANPAQQKEQKPYLVERLLF